MGFYRQNSDIHHFTLSLLIVNQIVTWPHLTATETKKWSLVLCRRGETCLVSLIASYTFNSDLCALSCFQLCNPMDCSPLGISVHGALQAWMLEWVAMLSSRGYSLLRDWTSASCVSYIAGGNRTAEPTGKPLNLHKCILNLDFSKPIYRKKILIYI